MLQLLKIASVLTVIAAIATVGIVGYYVYQGKTTPEELNEAGPSESLSKLNPNAEEGEMAPLVAQAIAFSLKIDPPPQLASPISTAGANTQGNKLPPNTDIKPQSHPSRLKLIATCRYDKKPEMSLALIDMAAKGQEWFRQGENIEHLTLYEVRDGSVVLYQGEQFNNELYMTEKKVVSLLKTDESDSDQAMVTGNSMSTSGGRPGPRIPGQDPRTQATRTRTQPTQPTLEQQKEMAHDNLKGFREIMNVSEMSPEDQKNMAEFLKVLENNMKKLDKDIQKNKAAKPGNKPK